MSIENAGRSVLLITIFTILGKAFGFFRNIIISYYYGVSLRTDMFYIANGFIADLLYAIVTALAIAFVPIYIGCKEDVGNIRSKEFAGKTLIGSLVFALCITALVIIFAPYLAKACAPLYSAKEIILLTKYIRVIASGIVFLTGERLLENLLNAERIYGYSSFSAIINSVVIIMVIILFSRIIDIWALVIAVPVSYFIQYIFLYIKSAKWVQIGNPFSRMSEFSELLKNIWPILFSNTTLAVKQFIARILLSIVSIGAVSAVSYAGTVSDLVICVITVPLTTVLFTELSEMHVNKQTLRVQETMERGITITIHICMPVLIFAIMCAEEIIQVLFQRGEFGIDSVKLTAVAMILLMINTGPYSVKYVIQRIFYISGNNKIPMAIGIIEILLNIFLAIILSKNFGMIGVLSAQVISTFIALVMCYCAISKINYHLNLNRLLKSVSKATISSMVMCLLMYLIKKWIVLQIQNSLMIILITGFCGIIAYILSGFLLKNEELLFLKKYIGSIISKNKGRHHA